MKLGTLLLLSTLFTAVAFHATARADGGTQAWNFSGIEAGVSEIHGLINAGQFEGEDLAALQNLSAQISRAAGEMQRTEQEVAGRFQSSRKVSAEMRTDAAVLAQEADARYALLTEQLSVMYRIDNTASELLSVWKGSAAQAVQSALERVHDRIVLKHRELADAEEYYKRLGLEYAQHDAQEQQGIRDRMDF